MRRARISRQARSTPPRCARSKTTPSATSCKLQEDVGLPIVTDGEFRRENWYADFIGKLKGVVIAAGAGQGFAQQGGQPKHVPKRVQTIGKVSAPAPIVLDDYQFLASATSRAAKVTIPSPTRLHFHGGRHAVSETAYPDIEAFFADVAEGLSRRDRGAGTGRLPIHSDRRSTVELLPQPGAAAGGRRRRRRSRPPARPLCAAGQRLHPRQRARDDHRNPYLPRQCAQLLDRARRL